MKRTCLLVSMALWVANCLGTDPVNGWDYKYDVAAPGTRSESVFGKLFFKGHELPEAFSHVITPIGEFLYSHTGAYGPNNDEAGWLPVGKFPDGRMEPAGTKKDVKEFLSGNDADCRRTAIKEAPAVASAEPCLAGTFEKPPKGVGTDWLYVVDKGLWVNPEKIDQVLKEKFTK